MAKTDMIDNVAQVTMMIVMGPFMLLFSIGEWFMKNEWRDVGDNPANFFWNWFFVVPGMFLNGLFEFLAQVGGLFIGWVKSVPTRLQASWKQPENKLFLIPFITVSWVFMVVLVIIMFILYWFYMFLAIRQYRKKQKHTEFKSKKLKQNVYLTYALMKFFMLLATTCFIFAFGCYAKDPQTAGVAAVVFFLVFFLVWSLPAMIKYGLHDKISGNLRDPLFHTIPFIFG